MSGFKVGRSSLLEYVSDSDSSGSYDMESDLKDRFHEKSDDLIQQSSLQQSSCILVNQEPVSPVLNKQEFMKIKDEEIRMLENKCEAAESKLAEVTEKLGQETRQLQKSVQLNNEMEKQIAELKSNELKNQEEIEEMANQLQRLMEEKTQLEYIIDMCKSDHFNDKTTYETKLNDLSVENKKLRSENEATSDVIEKMLQNDDEKKEFFKQEQARFELETEALVEEVTQLTKTIETMSEKDKDLKAAYDRQTQEIAQLTESKLNADTVCENKLQMIEAEVAELKKTNLNLSQKLDVIQNLVRSSVYQLINCVTAPIPLAIQKQIKDESSNLKEIRECQLEIGPKTLSLENGDIGEPQSEQTKSNESTFMEKLVDCYWAHDTHPDFLLGLEVHNFTIQRSLHIDEIVIPNQCVSIITLCKTKQQEEIESYAEKLAVGYGVDRNASFKSAVQNIKENRHFMKISKFGKSSTHPSKKS